MPNEYPEHKAVAEVMEALKTRKYTSINGWKRRWGYSTNKTKRVLRDICGSILPQNGKLFSSLYTLWGESVGMSESGHTPVSRKENSHLREFRATMRKIDLILLYSSNSKQSLKTITTSIHRLQQIVDIWSGVDAVRKSEARELKEFFITVYKSKYPTKNGLFFRAAEHTHFLRAIKTLGMDAAKDQITGYFQLEKADEYGTVGACFTQDSLHKVLAAGCVNPKIRRA